MEQENKEETITHVEIPEGDTSTGDDGADDGDEGTEKPTLAELAETGLSSGELEMARKQGLVQEEAKKDDDEGAAGAPEKKDGGTSGKKKEEKTVDERFRVLAGGKSADQIIADIGEKGDLTPEQEKVLLAALSNNGNTLYWAQKKERKRRMQIEAELGKEREDKQKEIDALKAENAALSKLRASGEEGDPLDTGDEEPEEVDPKKKPLTEEDLEKREKEKAEKEKKEREGKDQRAGEIKEALDFQQAEAKERYEDFEPALNATQEILKAAIAGTLDEIYPDSRQANRIYRKCQELLNAFAHADKFNDGDYNAADMTYELGKEHPEFGKKLKNSAAKNGETGADGDPEKAGRVIANANRRGSSATLAGGSRRVAIEELTPEQANKLPTREFNKLPKATRERLLGKK